MVNLFYFKQLNEQNTFLKNTDYFLKNSEKSVSLLKGSLYRAQVCVTITVKPEQLIVNQFLHHRHPGHVRMTSYAIWEFNFRERERRCCFGILQPYMKQNFTCVTRVHVIEFLNKCFTLVSYTNNQFHCYDCEHLIACYTAVDRDRTHFVECLV